MTFKKLSFRLGVSLFSAMILMPLAAQTVKADTTVTPDSASTTTTTTAAAQQPTVTVSNTTTNNNNNSVPTSVIATNTTPTTTTNNTTATTTANQNTNSTTSTAAATTTNSAVTTNNKPTSTTATPTNSTVATNTTTATNTTNATATNTATSNTNTPAATTVTATTTSPTNTTTTTPVTDPTTLAELESLPNNTVINFADPNITDAVKMSLQLPASSPVTVGDIKGFRGNSLNVSEAAYYAMTHSGTGYDQECAPVESLNGLQYLQLLPSSTTVMFDAKIASDPTADTDLSPLYGLKFFDLDLLGNYSNPNYKEIDINQLTNLNISQALTVTLDGDQDVSYGDGLTNQQLKTISPWLINYDMNLKNNTANITQIEFGNSSITDFTPLKPLENAPRINIIADTPVHLDYTPVYAVDNDPIAFTAPPVLGLDGDDLANGYHFSNSVPQQYLTEEDLTNLGNDHYVLEHPTPNAQVLAYGYVGFGYSANPDNYASRTYGNATFQYYILNGQPIIWQTHPTVTVNYLDSNKQPIMQNGKPLTTVLAGTNIGDPFDLTKTSQISGYELTSPITMLKGNFTQDPQVINLLYDEVEENDSSSSSNSSTNNSNEHQVQVYDENGQAVADTHIGLNNKLVTASIVKDHHTFYRINHSDKWVLEPDFYNQTSSEKTVRTFASDAKLIDAQGKRLTTTLAPNSQWQVIKTVKINGQKYYELAPNEFILAKDAVEFTPQTSKVHVPTDAMIYNSRGQALNAQLNSNSNWFSDGSAIIDHQKMYRVANDEWVKATDSYIYQPIKQI